MRCASLIIAIIAIIAGAHCTPYVDLETTQFRCTSDAECTSGYLCKERVCSKDVSAPIDAGTSTTCEPECSRWASCEAQKCERVGKYCTEGAASATENGFATTFEGTVPRDIATNGNIFCRPDLGILMTSLENEKSTLFFYERRFAQRFTLAMTFAIEIGEPTNIGDGMALAWIDGDSESIGEAGAFLGIGGLNGWYVEIDTHPNVDMAPCTPDIEPRATHVSLIRTTTATPGHPTDICLLGVVASATVAAVTDGATHELRVDFDDGVADIFLDHHKVLHAIATSYVPFDATFGAGAATYLTSDIQRIDALRLELR